MAKIAFMFPGQGSQSSGMGVDLCENFSSAKEVFDVADKVLGYSISKICFSGLSIIYLRLKTSHNEQMQAPNKIILPTERATSKVLPFVALFTK